MPNIGSIRDEIECLRKQAARLRRDILRLQRAGRATAMTEADLQNSTRPDG